MATAKSLPFLLFATFLVISSLLVPIPAQTQKLAMGPSPEATIAQFLKPQNVIRAQHGLPPLTWSTKVASFARWYASQRRNDCALVHSVGDLGENIFRGGGRQWKPLDAVVAWASEESIYNYKTNQCLHGKDCLHYTQLIWKTTTTVGCAKIVCKSGDTFITCNYYPHGNIIGQRPY